MHLQVLTTNRNIRIYKNAGEENLKSKYIYVLFMKFTIAI